MTETGIELSAEARTPGTAERGLLSGLVAATFTPMRPGGSVDLDAVPAVTESVLGQGVDGLFLCGSTGESPSLSTDERMAVAQAYVDATNHRVPVVVHVGHNSLADARTLASHAAEIGADAIAVVPPSYFPPSSADALVECLAYIADAAPRTPLYYYHIPRLTGVGIKVVDLLEHAEGKLPTLVGVKFSSFELDDLLRCIRFGDRKYNVLFGSDEMLLAGLAMGAAGAVGSTYNFLAPYYRRVMDAFAQGRVEDAQDHQFTATRIVHSILKYGGHNAIKGAMGILGVDCGPTRLPIAPLSKDEMAALERDLEQVMASCEES